MRLPYDYQAALHKFTDASVKPAASVVKAVESFHNQNEGCTLYRNVSKTLPDYTASNPTIQ
jgi:hypothetical protein